MGTQETTSVNKLTLLALSSHNRCDQTTDYPIEHAWTPQKGVQD